MRWNRGLIVVFVLPLLVGAAATTQAAKSLQELRQRYATRTAELEKELRSFNVATSFRANPAVVASAELEGLKASARDLERNARDAKDAYDQAVLTVNNGEELPIVQREIERDADVKAIKIELARLQDAGEKTKASIIQRKLDDAVAESRARRTADILESLREQQRITAKQVGTLDERIHTASANVAATQERVSHEASARAELKLMQTVLHDLDEAIAAQGR